MRTIVTDRASYRWPDLLLLSLIGLIAFLPGLASLPPIDRDESRYMQATVQMVETGDIVDIRFQDDARHKKPAGAYWAQLTSLALTGQIEDVKRGERAVWAHRLPSVLGALIAIWATYLAGLRLLDRRSAFIGAGFLAVSVSLVFEAHIAKTDAMLAGASAVVLYGIAARRAWPVWMGLSAGMLLKGPVLIGVVALALIADGLISKSWDRLRGLLSPWPIITALILTLPWFIAIGLRTDGAFFAEALGRDFGGKIGSAQETHGGPPGYYLLTSLGMFWPGILALPLAAIYAWRNRAQPDIRLLLCWLIPMWLVLELVPTKLPHYTLPLYPALTLLAGAGWTQIAAPKARVIGLAITLIIGGVLSIAVALSLWDVARPWATIGVGATMGILTLAMLILFGKHREQGALVAAALILGVGFAGLSRSTLLDLSPRLVAAIPQGNQVVSPDYREPSLIYLAGTETKLTRKVSVGNILVLGQYSDPPACAVQIDQVSGTNYAKGQELFLSVLGTEDCNQAALDEWAASAVAP